MHVSLANEKSRISLTKIAIYACTSREKHNAATEAQKQILCRYIYIFNSANDWPNKQQPESNSDSANIDVSKADDACSCQQLSNTGISQCSFSHCSTCFGISYRC